jgi:hypothetical protein
VNKAGYCNCVMMLLGPARCLVRRQEPLFGHRLGCRSGTRHQRELVESPNPPPHRSSPPHPVGCALRIVLVPIIAMVCAGCGTPAAPTPAPKSTALVAPPWMVSRTGPHTAEVAPAPAGPGRAPEAGEFQATVVSTDVSYRMLKLRRADGMTEVLKIGLSSDLGSLRPGTLVVVRAVNGPVIFQK